MLGKLSSAPGDYQALITKGQCMTHANCDRVLVVTERSGQIAHNYTSCFNLARALSIFLLQTWPVMPCTQSLSQGSCFLPTHENSRASCIGRAACVLYRCLPGPLPPFNVVISTMQSAALRGRRAFSGAQQRRTAVRVRAEAVAIPEGFAKVPISDDNSANWARMQGQKPAARPSDLTLKFSIGRCNV